MIELTKKQNETILACKTNNSGIISNTCGTGKTLCEINAIIDEFNNGSICALGSHRLALNSQLTEAWRNEIISITKNENNKIRVIEISSNSNSVADKIINTKDNILAEINYAKRNNEKLLIIFCYASISKLVNALENKENEKKIDLCIFDEAHIGQMNEKYDGDINNKLALCKHSKKYYGFTATPNNKLINNELGLKVIQTYSYYDALNDDAVVPFKFYGSLFSDDNEVIDSKNKLGRSRLGTTIAAFEHLSKEFEFPSLLVCGTSLEENDKINRFLIEKYDKEIKNNELDIFLFSSEKITKDGIITSMINGEKIKVKECFSKIKESNKKKIIIHCNMLSEGIDVPNINGVLIFGEKSKASLYQSIMRGCRVDSDDRILRKSIKNNKISQYAKFKKPHFNVYTSFEEKDSANQMQNFLKNLKYYGINIDEDFSINQFDGSSIEEISKINFNDDFSARFKSAISMVIKEDKENSIKIENTNIIEKFKNEFHTIRSLAGRVKYFEEMSDKYKELSFEFSKNFDLKYNNEFKMNGLSNPLYQKSKEMIADKTNTSILVINDFFTALCLSLSHKVIYLTNDEECSKYFNKYVNDEKFGNNDEAIYVCENKENAWLKIIQELNMEFDYIFGNPPYNGNLHLKILEKSYKKLNENGKLIFVHPSRWCSDLAYYSKKDSIDIKKYYNLPFQKFEVISAKEANRIFDISLFGDGLIISQIDKNKEKYYKTIEDLVLDVKGNILNSKYLKNIYNKVKNKMPANLETVYKKSFNLFNTKYSIILKTILSNNGESVSSFNFASSNHGIYKNGYYNGKSYMDNKCFSGGATRKEKIINFIEFNTENEAKNCLDYFKTIFYRFIIMMMNNDMHVNWKAMPFMINYNLPWDDEKLFNYFEINKEEKEEIYNIMKPYI